MEFVADPQLPHERKLDTGLEERTESWGPEFMLMLIERYRAYLTNNCEVSIPAKVEHNLQEQREENDPLPGWLSRVLEPKAGNRIHVHLLMELFNSAQPAGGKKYQGREFATKLKNLRIALGDTQGRILGCTCKEKNTYIDGYQFKEDEPDVV